jgi:hypothetical protein
MPLLTRHFDEDKAVLFIRYQRRRIRFIRGTTGLKIELKINAAFLRLMLILMI